MKTPDTARRRAYVSPCGPPLLVMAPADRPVKIRRCQYGAPCRPSSRSAAASSSPGWSHRWAGACQIGQPHAPRVVARGGRVEQARPGAPTDVRGTRRVVNRQEPLRTSRRPTPTTLGVGCWSRHPALFSAEMGRPVAAGDGRQCLARRPSRQWAPGRRPSAAPRARAGGPRTRADQYRRPVGLEVAREDHLAWPIGLGSDGNDTTRVAAFNNETEQQYQGTNQPPDGVGYRRCRCARNPNDEGGRAMSRTRAPSMRGGRRTTASHQSRARRLPVTLASATPNPPYLRTIRPLALAAQQLGYSRRSQGHHVSQAASRRPPVVQLTRRALSRKLTTRRASPPTSRATYPSRRAKTPPSLN
jgi:hypothetical protein